MKKDIDEIIEKIAAEKERLAIMEKELLLLECIELMASRIENNVIKDVVMLDLPTPIEPNRCIIVFKINNKEYACQYNIKSGGLNRSDVISIIAEQLAKILVDNIDVKPILSGDF